MKGPFMYLLFLVFLDIGNCATQKNFLDYQVVLIVSSEDATPKVVVLTLTLYRFSELSSKMKLTRKSFPK